MWIEQNFRHGLDNFKIDSLQTRDTLRKILSQLDSVHGDDSWIEDHSYIFGISYYREISNLFSSIWHISHFRSTLILDWCAPQTRKVAGYTASWTQVIGGGIPKISFLPEWRLCQSFGHLTRPTWHMFGAIGMPGHCISRLVIFDKICTGHLNRAPGFSLGWSPVPWEVPKILMMHGFLRMELCRLHSGNLTQLAPAPNRIVPMYSADYVMLFWQPGLGIIQNKSWLLRSHMAHARCVKFQKVRR